jgi:hypothetical protein
MPAASRPLSSSFPSSGSSAHWTRLAIRSHIALAAVAAVGGYRDDRNTFRIFLMTYSPPPRSPCVRILAVAVVIVASLTAGCTQGDFGEVRPSLVRDGIHDWMSGAATAGTPSSFELTEDERQLRDLAYPLIEPPYDRQRWYSVLNEYGASAKSYRVGIDRPAYANNLLSSRYRSPSSRYAQLIDDIRNDITRIPPFFETAARVLDIDIKRQKSLSYVSELSASERSNSFRRIRENATIARWAHSSLSQRLSSYRFALERLVVMTPSPQAAEAELALNTLRAQIARYRIGAPPVRKG